jgi:hypothetical protein
MVVAVNALHTLNNGVEGRVRYVSSSEVNVVLTHVPNGSDLRVGETFTFIPASLELKPAGPVLISVEEVRVGDEIEVTTRYRGVKNVTTGVVHHYGQLTYYTKDNGIIFSREWDGVEVRLIKAYEHPLETAVPGTRFSVEYPEWDVSTYEVVKHAQGFWLREEFDKQGVLIGLIPFREETARKLYDTKNGKLKK